MNFGNRRLREIQRDIQAYRNLHDSTEKQSERLIYEGKIKSLEKEEKDILKRYGVII